MKNKHDITKSILKRIRVIEQDENDGVFNDNRERSNSYDKDRDALEKHEDRYRKFLINGSLVQISGIDATELEFTENEKETFKSSIQAFIDNITDLVEFKILNISSDNIEWVGEFTQENIEWVYSLDDQNGCYVSGNMIQLTDETTQLLGRLKQNYKEWSSSWGRILSERRTERRKKMGKEERAKI